MTMDIRPKPYIKDYDPKTHEPVQDNMSLFIEVHNGIKNAGALRMLDKKAAKEIDESTDAVTASVVKFSSALDSLAKAETQLAVSSKNVSGKIRDSANKLAGGLKKVEAQANFSKLEKYVDLLERAEKAMSSLAELEKSGKLDKILAAVK